VEVLGAGARSEITWAGVSRGFLLTNLTINFANGGSWEFEVSPFVRFRPNWKPSSESR
jgi:hypothetical protein